MRAIKTSQAEEDLIALWIYIAQDNPRAADQLIDTIDDACESLVRQPKMGVALPHIHRELRYFPARAYLIFYRIVGDDVSILRVLHGAREWHEILSGSID